MGPKLSVNVNAIAYLRNRRDVPWPDLVGLSRAALSAGAHGITIHPRPDERHIRRADVAPLAALVRATPGAEFNVEGYPSEDFVALCAAVRPHQVTLVPDAPGQATSDHGWDCLRHAGLLSTVVAGLKARGVRVSVFLDADPGQVGAAAATGADRIELYTGPYGAAHSDPERAARAVAALGATADAARAVGLGVNAGHDLTVSNLPALVRRVPFLAEVSIGHALTAEALEHGMAGAVRRFLAACAG